MSEKQLFILAHTQAREGALNAVKHAPDGFCVEIKPRTRTLDQNAKLWAMLTEVSNQVLWHGRKLTQTDWKHIFSSSLKRMDVVPNLEGTGFVALGLSTSKMTKKEMSDLVVLIHAFGVEHGVEFRDVQ